MARFNPLQNSFTAGVLSARLAVRNDLTQINSGMRQGQNGIVLPQGGYMKRPGSIFVTEAKNRNAPTALIKFSTSVQQQYIMEFGKDSTGVGYTRFFANGGIVETSPGSGVPYEVANIFDDPQGLRVAQDADVMWVAHNNHYPYTLSRTAFNAFAFAKGKWTTTSCGPCRPTNNTATTVTISGGTATASAPIFSTTNDVNRTLKLDDETYYNITAVTDTTHASVTGPLASITTGVGDGTATGPTINWALGLFSDTEGCSAVTFHQGRLWFGGAPNAPDWVVGSVSDDFTNFDRGTTTGTTPTSGDDDRSIGKRLVSDEVNTIYWMKGFGQILIAGCSGAEFRLFGSTNELLTPTGTVVRPATNVGSAFSPPLAVDNAGIFIQRARRGLYELQYDILRDQITARDLFLFSEDAYDASANGLKGAQRLAFQRVPDKVIWSIHGDGHLVSMTYLPEQQVFGTSHHYFGGVTIDLNVIQNVNQDADTLWLVSDYTIGGVPRRYITYMADYYRPAGINRKSSMADRIAALNTAYFVDCGFDTTLGSPASTVSGLSHLIGQTVAVLLDGKVHPTVIVDSGGSITTIRSGTHFVVGLPYSYFGETERFEGGGKLGTAIAQKAQIQRMGVVLQNTLDCKVGRGPNPAASVLETIQFRTGSSNMDQSPPLTSGEFDVAIEGKWDDDVTVYWESDAALPCTVLAVAPRIKVGER